MNFKRLLNTQLGVFFISLILGLGLASLFRRVCNDRNCIIFNGPIISEFEDKTYKQDGKCYKYSLTQGKCDNNKQILPMESLPENMRTLNNFV